LPTASVIKVLTALAVLQQQPMDAHDNGPDIIIQASDIESYNHFISQDGSVVAVQLGERLTERQALEALLLPSANNIAVLLAHWAFGSVDAYVAYANSYARELGMKHTTVTDPSGLLASTMSTPSDLVILGETALENPVIAQIVGEKSAVIPVEGEISNVNGLLGRDGIVGIKTGNNDGDPGCFLSAASRTIGGKQLTIITVIMGAPDLFTALHDSLPLIASTAANFTIVPIAKAHQSVAHYSLPWSTDVAVMAPNDITAVVWRDSTTTVALSLDQPKNSLAAGIATGQFIIHNSRFSQAQTSTVVLQQAVPAPNLWWRLLHPR